MVCTLLIFYFSYPLAGEWRRVVSRAAAPNPPCRPEEAGGVGALVRGAGQRAGALRFSQVEDVALRLPQGGGETHPNGSGLAQGLQVQVSE